MPLLDMQARSRIPEPIRTILFKVYPGRWTSAEKQYLVRRNLALLAEMQQLHEQRFR